MYVSGFSAFIVFSLIFGHYAEASQINKTNALLDEETTDLAATNAELLRGGKQGAAGELVLIQAVDEALSSLGVWYCTNSHAGFPDAVILRAGKSALSSEIDLLVATSFGIYVLESKNWPGYWTYGDPGNLKVSYDGKEQPKQREDPLRKTLGKLQHVMRDIQPYVGRAVLIVNTHPTGRFDPKLGSPYIHVSELATFFKAERDKNVEIDGMDEFFEATFSTLDRSPRAKHDHMMRLPCDKPKIAEYQSNHLKLIQLANTPRESPPDKQTSGILIALGIAISTLLLSLSLSHREIMLANEQTIASQKAIAHMASDKKLPKKIASKN